MRGLSLAERNTPFAQIFDLYSGYFALAGSFYCRKADVFVTGHLSVHSLIILPPLSLSNIYERRKHYRKKFIYSDE